MDASKTFCLAAAMTALVVPELVFAACSHDTAILNGSSVTLRIVELKSASSPPVFKSQWTGNLVIAPGDTKTISWTSDLNCEDGTGRENVFDVKLIRKIGATHYCSRLTPGQNVKLEAPDLCFRL